MLRAKTLTNLENSNIMALRVNLPSRRGKPSEMPAFDMPPKAKAEYRIKYDKGGDVFNKKFTGLTPIF